MERSEFRFFVPVVVCGCFSGGSVALRASSITHRHTASFKTTTRSLVGGETGKGRERGWTWELIAYTVEEDEEGFGMNGGRN